MQEYNFFDIEKEFFLIDSDNLDEVETRFYGYSVQKNGIYEEDNLTAEAIEGLDGRGCYVYVKMADGHVNIQQDICGSYGIYFFRHEDYFALSNSFFRLLHHVSEKYPLTVNKDYAHHILVNALASQSPEMTPVEEISLLDRWAILDIDVESKSLEIEMAPYNELSLSLDTQKGIDVLDEWFDFWTSLLKRLAEKTEFITVDLSGGYDSRLTFLLMLCSGVDLNKIRVYSNDDGLHTHVEDYAIASEIANHYGFKLNKPLPKTEWLNYSIEDTLNIELFTKMGFHKEPYLKTRVPVDKLYAIIGAAGEAIRERYTITAEEYIQLNMPQAKQYSTVLENEIFKSVKKVINDGYSLVERKYGMPDRSSAYPQYMYRDAMTRNHYGKTMAVNYFGGTITLTPLIDPLLWKLRLHTKKCNNFNFLMAMIYVRYCPDLMNFRFEGTSYFLSKETIEFAKEQNANFEVKKFLSSNSDLLLSDKNKNVINNFRKQCQNVAHTREDVNNIFKQVFDTTEIKGLFTTCFDEQFYEEAGLYCKIRKFVPLRHCVGILGMAHVIKIAIASRVNEHLKNNGSFFSGIVLSERRYQNRNDAFKRFKDFITARIDFKLRGVSDLNDFNLIEIDDDLAIWEKPDWFQNNGVGIVLNSTSGLLNASLKCSKAGKFHILLRGLDIREPNDKAKRVPYWIDYQNLYINDKPIFTEVHPAWHDKPFGYMVDVEEGEIITISTAWTPHYSES